MLTSSAVLKLDVCSEQLSITLTICLTDGRSCWLSSSLLRKRRMLTQSMLWNWHWYDILYRRAIRSATQWFNGEVLCWFGCKKFYLSNSFKWVGRGQCNGNGILCSRQLGETNKRPVTLSMTQNGTERKRQPPSNLNRPTRRLPARFREKQQSLWRPQETTERLKWSLAWAASCCSIYSRARFAPPLLFVKLKISYCLAFLIRSKAFP